MILYIAYSETAQFIAYLFQIGYLHVSLGIEICLNSQLVLTDPHSIIIINNKQQKDHRLRMALADR